MEWWVGFLILICLWDINEEVTRIRKAVEEPDSDKKIDSAESLENKENSQTA